MCKPSPPPRPASPTSVSGFPPPPLSPSPPPSPPSCPLDRALLLLSLDRTSSPGQVKKRFRELCLVHHPDKLASRPASAPSLDFPALLDAYALLKSSYPASAPPRLRCRCPACDRPPASLADALRSLLAAASAAKSKAPQPTGTPLSELTRNVVRQCQKGDPKGDPMAHFRMLRAKRGRRAAGAGGRLAWGSFEPVILSQKKLNL